jgi:tetratricopeptide (TPR) repeat protein
VLGGLLMVFPPLAGVAIWVRSLFVERRLRRAGELSVAGPWSLWLLAIGLVWVPVAFFPHSNIPVLLPTVRAERFWYLPALGSALLLATLFVSLADRGKRQLLSSLVGIYFTVQIIQARAHALDYTNDLVFWRATREAVPRSAKAHLNYSVMLGAREKLNERLVINGEAMRLAPNWPMAHVYYGDTLCRLKRPEQAWPHYRRGFELAPNDPNLIALALQCLWDQKGIEARHDELLELSEKHPGSWLAFLATDIVYNGEAHGGVQKKYRPRSYDEGPKK